MKALIQKNIVLPMALIITPFPGMAFRTIKGIIKSFFPRKPKFYSPKEEAASKAAMEIHKNQFPGQGPPL